MKSPTKEVAVVIPVFPTLKTLRLLTCRSIALLETDDVVSVILSFIPLYSTDDVFHSAVRSEIFTYAIFYKYKLTLK